MTTHEVEVIFGITKQTLIYYEKEGLVVCQRDANNYRNYSSKDLDTLKMVLLLRSMEISIDEIKLIMNSELSIRYVLERKQEYIEQLQIELKDIDEKIKAYIQRHKVEVIFDNSINHEYEGLLDVYKRQQLKLLSILNLWMNSTVLTIFVVIKLTIF